MTFIAVTFTTIPVEPGVIDTNVLIYALDADSPNHQSSRALLQAAQDGSASLYVFSQILCEFYSIVTNARRVAKPRSSADAMNAIAGLLGFLQILPVPASTVESWLRLLARHPVTGADIFDLQIIATMQANAIHRIYAFNHNDFASFSVRGAKVWVNSLSKSKEGQGLCPWTPLETSPQTPFV